MNAKQGFVSKGLADANALYLFLLTKKFPFLIAKAAKF